MIDKVTFEQTTFAPPPQRFEAGTPNVADAIGLAEAFRYMAQTDLSSACHHETQLLKEPAKASKKLMDSSSTAQLPANLRFCLFP